MPASTLSFAPAGADAAVWTWPHGFSRGLLSIAAPRLGMNGRSISPEDEDDLEQD